MVCMKIIRKALEHGNSERVETQIEHLWMDLECFEAANQVIRDQCKFQSFDNTREDLTQRSVDRMCEEVICKVFEHGNIDLFKTRCEHGSTDLERI